MTEPHANHEPSTPARALSAYLLGTLEMDAFLALQRRLVFELSSNRTVGALILCDHPSGITIGREGSRAHIRPNFESLGGRLRPDRRTASPIDPPIRWVNRGGGVMLHLSGQIACYPVVPLDLLGLTAAQYVAELQNIGVELLRKYELAGVPDPENPGIRVNGRRVIHVGVSVRENIACYGMVVNVHPELALFHRVHCDGDSTPMTSLRRESPARVRLTGIRQQLVELIATRFGFDRVSIFHSHPSLTAKPADADRSATIKPVRGLSARPD